MVGKTVYVTGTGGQEGYTRKEESAKSIIGVKIEHKGSSYEPLYVW